MMPSDERFAEFVAAQDRVYDNVRRELAAARKESHWMWFIFPQISGLGSSGMAQKFAIHTIDEARHYLAHPVLGPRLRECTRLMLAAPQNDATSILGYPDNLKFRSCLTLFGAAAPEEELFAQALEKFFGGESDAKTIELLATSAAQRSA